LSDWYTRANALGRLGDYERALPFAERAVSEDPQAWWNWCTLSASLRGLARYGEALTAAERALALEPDAEWAHRLRAGALSGLGRRTEAIEAARRAVAIRPNESRAWGRLAETAKALGFPREARRAAERGVELEPDETQSWLTLGFVCLGFDWDEAALASERALRLDPENKSAINNLGWARLNQGQFQEARELFDRAIIIAPDFLTSLFNRAVATGYIDGPEAGAFEYTRARSLALATHDRQLAENPRNGSAHTGRAQMLRGLGENATVVLAAARQGVSLDPRSANSWSELRVAAAIAGRWPLARYAARRAVEADAGSPDRWLNAAEVAQHAGHVEEAAEWSRRVVAEAPESIESGHAQALLLWLDGNFNEARVHVRQYLDRNPLHCCARVFLAACAIELGDKRGAHEALGHAELRSPTCGCFRRLRVAGLLQQTTGG
jgi:tetratricopeptide (TPR) repeat protein